MKEDRNSKIIMVAQQIKSTVDDGGKIWKIKRKVQGKNQTPYTIKDEKKQQNWMFIPDFRGTQKILWKSTENKTVREGWGNTNTVQSRKRIPTDYQ